VPAISPVLDADIAEELARIERAGLRRRLLPIESGTDAEVTVAGERLVLMSSNNYLGLASHPALKAAARQAIDRYGTGTGSSRLIAGHADLHVEVEAKLAAFKRTEAAILFPSGYQANVGTIGALVGRGDHVFSDELNHASIIDGCRLSRATTHVYPHCKMQSLAAALARAPKEGRRLIVTDSVFSMDGDRAPLAELIEIAEHYHSVIMVDEAHATGVLGAHGAGLVDERGLGDRVSVQMGTLGKALGSAGAYVAGSRLLVDLLVNRARSFIFTTGLAPASVAAAGAAIDVIAAEPERRRTLARNAAYLRDGLRAQGFEVGGDTHVVPVVLGENDRTVAFSAALRRHGVLVHAIRPPTVPAGTARLRVTPIATHTREHLDRTLAAFAAAAREIGTSR
jgi:8-amino-7-oxononanoate synthase